MGQPITTTSRGTNKINQDRRVVDMSDKISLLKPAAFPFTYLLSKLSKESAYNTRFQWLEEDLMSVWVESNTTIAAGITALVLKAGQGVQVAVEDLLRVAVTGEVLRVTAIATDTITVTRGFGGTVAAQITANDKIVVLGNAMMQGGVSPAEKYVNTRTQYNYTQIVKTPFSLTNTLDAVKLYGGKEYSRLANRKGIEHGRSLEQMLLFGVRSEDVAGAQPVLTTGGVLQFMKGTTNDLNINESLLTLDKFFELAETIFTYGNQTKLWLVSPRWMTAVAKIAADFIHTDASDKTLGLEITSVKTPHGTLKMVQHPLFNNGFYDLSLALDMEEITYRPLQGRDTKLETNIQNNDEDGRRDQYITEAGLEFKQPKKHTLLKMNIGS